MHDVVLSAEARRAYAEAQPALQRKLDRCFDQLKQDPRRHPNIKHLKGEYRAAWRFRIGDYRVVYLIDDAAALVTVVNIVNRRDAYD